MRVAELHRAKQLGMATTNFTNSTGLPDPNLYTTARDISALARSIVAKGPKVVFITEGAKGARAVTADQDIFVAAQKVTVVDTVGAGDTSNAGVLAALHQAGALTKAGVASLTDATLTAALSLGTRSAAVTVSRAGANPPWANEL